MNLMKTSLLLAGLTALFLMAGYMLGGEGGMMIALLFAIGTNVFAYWNSDKMLLRMYGAKEFAPQHPLVQATARLAQRADIPAPRVYMLASAQPNAFATGRNPDNAAIAISEGLMRTLNQQEIEGVIAHELAHIKNRDTLIMTITATIAGALGMLANFALFFGNNRNNPLGFLGVLLMMILAPLAATLVQLAISRTREYAADRTGAEICGNPLALASALEKIAHSARHIDYNAVERNPATAHLFIINPLHSHKIDNLFSTHPNTENRVRALREMAGTLRKEAVRAAHYASGPWG